MFESEGQSCWSASARLPEYPCLDRSLDVDAAVIGGGLTGVTIACLLKRAGLRVALLERDRCGSGETGRGLGYATPLSSLPLASSVERIGEDDARALWDAGFEAIVRIRGEVRDQRINCGFAWVPGCFHAGDEGDDRQQRSLTEEAVTAKLLGIDATYTSLVPGLDEPGVWFGGQIRLHPLQYLSVLLAMLDGDGSFVFERTEVDRVRASHHDLLAGPHTVRAPFVVSATATPPPDVLADAPRLRAALVASTSYSIAGTAPRGALGEGIYWERRESPVCLRVDRMPDGRRITFGAVDHGVRSARAATDRFVRLERHLRQRVPLVEIEHQWTGTIVESADRRPCIGEVQPGVFVATAFGSNPLAYGMLAATMALDCVQGTACRWASLFDPMRFARSTESPPSGPSPSGDVPGRHPHASVA